MQLQSLKTAAVEIPELKMLLHSLPLTLRTPGCTDGLKIQSTQSTSLNQIITTVQLVSLHSKTNHYLKCFGLFRLNYQDTHNYLTNINDLLDWLA